jgi:hypothetical protein
VRDEVILLAEDNADMAEMFVMVLDRSGFRANSFIDKITSRVAYPELVPLIAQYWLYANESPSFSA